MINRILYSYWAFVFGILFIPLTLLASGMDSLTFANLFIRGEDRTFFLVLDLMLGVFCAVFVFTNDKDA